MRRPSRNRWTEEIQDEKFTGTAGWKDMTKYVAQQTVGLKTGKVRRVRRPPTLVTENIQCERSLYSSHHAWSNTTVWLEGTPRNLTRCYFLTGVMAHSGNKLFECVAVLDDVLILAAYVLLLFHPWDGM